MYQHLLIKVFMFFIDAIMQLVHEFISYLNPITFLTCCLRKNEPSYHYYLFLLLQTEHRTSKNNNDERKPSIEKLIFNGYI